MQRLYWIFLPVWAISAAQNDYYLQFNAANAGPVPVAAGSPNAAPLVPPPGACGMRFQKTPGPESDDMAIETDWIVPFDVAGPSIPDGAFDAYLGACGWPGLALESENGVGQIAPPGGFAGTLAIHDVYGYWIDGKGNKLVYKNPPCLPTCLGAKDFTVGNGWSIAISHLQASKRMLGGIAEVRPASLLFNVSERSLRQLAQNIAEAVAQRRLFVAGVLESSIRVSEDEATRRLAIAATQQRECRAMHGRGDAKSAAIACDAALTSMSLARASLKATAGWVSW